MLNVSGHYLIFIWQVPGSIHFLFGLKNSFICEIKNCLRDIFCMKVIMFVFICDSSLAGSPDSAAIGLVL